MGSRDACHFQGESYVNASAAGRVLGVGGPKLAQEVLALFGAEPHLIPNRQRQYWRCSEVHACLQELRKHNAFGGDSMRDLAKQYIQVKSNLPTTSGR